MGNYTLPAVNQRVDIWFDGYDQYYGGRVDSVSAPYRFHAVLDDKSEWDIDVRKNVYRLSTDLPEDEDGSDADRVAGEVGDEEETGDQENGNGNENPEDDAQDAVGATATPADDDEKNDEEENGANDVAAATPEVDHIVEGKSTTPFAKDDDDMNAPVPTAAAGRSEKPSDVDRDPTMSKSARMDVSPSPVLRFKEAKSTPPTRTTRRTAAATGTGTATATADPDPQAGSGTDDTQPPNSTKPGPRTRTSHDPSSGLKPTTAAQRLAIQQQQKRRTSGRALRKNVGNAASQRTPPPPPPPLPQQQQQAMLPRRSNTPERPRRAAAAAAAAQHQKQLMLQSDAADFDADANAKTATLSTPTRAMRAARRAVVEDGSSQTPSRSQSTEARRRGRPPASTAAAAPASTAGAEVGARKRTLAEVAGSGSGNGVSGGTSKRRRRPDEMTGGDEATGAMGSVAGGRLTRSATAARETVREEGQKISTKTLTAVAVEAALETTKAVMKPVNDRLNKVLKDLEVVTKELLAAKASGKSGGDGNGGSGAISRRKVGAVGAAGRAGTAVLSATALENFEVDVSEIIGGGEARVKAYSNMSQSEFEGLHRVIQQQGNSLKELDRLLYAARAFGEKAKQKSKKGAAPVAEDGGGGGGGGGGGAEKSAEKSAELTADGEGNRVEAGATEQG